MTQVSDGQMSADDRLIYMANQIARNLATMNQDFVATVADHIASFWDPRMRARIDVLLKDRPSEFSSAAALAVERLRRETVVPQTPATEFNAVDQIGRCDAG